jgi:hypothetical protein
MRASLRLRLLRGGGAGLIILGVVHLLATPHIATLLRRSMTAAAAEWLTPPMLLNHVLVGVLLIPLGYLTLYAAPDAVRGSSWAQMTVRTVSISAASLPIALFSLMGNRYFLDAPLFVLGAALTVAAAVLLLVAAFSK